MKKKRVSHPTNIIDVTDISEEREDVLSPNCPRISYTVATDIRKLEEINSSGLQIEYRCTRCRDCKLCKDADFTERTSLRQDAEDELIKESVTLDYANKRIMASLPIRGPEEEFLASNRPTAKHILDGQCKKAQKTPEDIPAIKKSFKKLFDRGHCAKIKDLPKDVQKKFMGKPVQHYLCWGLAYNPKSTSTPVRPVMDASTKLQEKDA